MESAVRQIKIIRVGPDGTGTAADDELISEKTVSLYVDGRYDHAAVITGGGEKLWAAGNLKCRGLISSADDIEDISVNGNIIGVRLKRRRVPLKPAPLPVEWQVGPELVRQKIAELAQAKLYLRTGCLHVALLSSNRGESLFSAEDVGRRNAVDKAAGWLLYEGADPAASLLFISGRMPGDMVLKAANAGIPFIASVSAPTADGVAAARAANITMIGFARGGGFNIYSADGRVELAEKEL